MIWIAHPGIDMGDLSRQGTIDDRRQITSP
jgi:hypothetical protein